MPRKQIAGAAPSRRSFQAPRIIEIERPRPEPNGGMPYRSEYYQTDTLRHFIPSWRFWVVSRAIARRSQKKETR